MTASIAQPVIRGVRFFLAHGPGLIRYGSKPSRDIARDAGLLEAIRGQTRDYAAAVAYPPNRVFLGALHPDALGELERPWFEHTGGGERWGPHGELMPQEEFYGVLKLCDEARLVTLERDLTERVREALSHHPLIAPSDLERLGEGVTQQELARVLAEAEQGKGLPAIPLEGQSDGGNFGPVGLLRAGHEDDPSLTAAVLLENLACKATAVMALRTLLAQEGIDPESVPYVLNSGEEAVGDRYQRGGGNLGKAVAEFSGCRLATGVDVKGFCAGPLHALAIAGGLVASRMFERVAVIGGCSLAKLGMKYRGHLLHGQPILEDVLAGVAILVSAESGGYPRMRLDAIGLHTVAAGSSQEDILRHLVTRPLQRMGLRYGDIDKYATELHNPELTEPAGSGNVPELNYRTIGGLAALDGEIAPAEVKAFAARHGMPGFSPTQGHIASAVPFLGHALDGLRSGSLRRTMFLAKGSLFLGRMTQLSDGISITLEGDG